MSRNLINVVEEFRRSPEVQHRKNAVTALAVIADEEASAKLVDVALTDMDPSVRQRAEQEILSLEAGARESAIETAKRGLEGPNKQAVYVLLGRLRNNGWYIPFSRSPLLTWIRLALGLNGHLYPVRNWKFRTRAWKYGLFGGLAAVAFLTIIFIRSWSLDDRGSFATLCVAILFFSPLTAVVATARTSPIGLHLDHLLGFLTETFIPLLFGFFWFFGPLAFYIVITQLNKGDEWLLLIPLIPGVFLAVVRSGTMIGYGRYVNRRWNWLAQVVMGVATGTLALTITNFITWGIDPENEVMGGLWIMLFPVSFITANAFAAIDNQTSPIRPLTGRLGTVLCILILVPFIAITGTILIMGRAVYDHQRGPTLDRIFESAVTSPIPDSSPSPQN